MTARHIDAADVAKLVRAELRMAFPETTFRVRTCRYAGGCSLRVSWTDGPREKEVERIAGPFKGSTFDGRQDCKVHHDSTYRGERVQYGNDFIFCHRTVSDEAAKHEAALRIIRERCVLANGGRQYGNHWIEDLAWAMVRDCDPDGSLDGAFRRVVLREEA